MSSQFRYTKVLVLVIESAMIYSAALLVEITLYFIGSNAFYIVYDPIAQLTVSAPCPYACHLPGPGTRELGTGLRHRYQH